MEVAALFFNRARPYLEGFVEGVQEMTGSFPFVLLVVNGGDAPLTEELQSQWLDDIWWHVFDVKR